MLCGNAIGRQSGSGSGGGYCVSVPSASGTFPCPSGTGGGQNASGGAIWIGYESRAPGGASVSLSCAGIGSESGTVTESGSSHRTL